MHIIKCVKCNLEKEQNLDNFSFRKDFNKWNKLCRSCISIRNKNYYKNNLEKITKQTSDYRILNRVIINDKATIYNNKKEIKDRMIKWRRENRKSLRIKEKEWRLKNPEKHKAISIKKAKKQRQKPSFKIRSHVSRQINFALHRQGTSKKGNSVLNFLSYTIQELKEHLEKQFEPWMNWGNYGIYRSSKWDDDNQSTWTWQIDHIIPQSMLLYISMEDENFKKCWALENLRPLNSKQNIFDGSNKVRHL